MANQKIRIHYFVLSTILDICCGGFDVTVRTKVYILKDRLLAHWSQSDRNIKNSYVTNVSVSICFAYKCGNQSGKYGLDIIIKRTTRCLHNIGIGVAIT